MLKSSVGQMAIGSVWLMGEDNKSTWAAVGVVGKKLWDKVKVDSLVMSTKSWFVQ